MRALRWLGVTWLLLLGLLAYLDSRMRASGQPGLLDFEFAGTGSRASEILRGWDASAESAARWAQAVDYLFAVVYALFLTLAVSRLGSKRPARMARVVIVMIVVAAVSDAVQNTALLIILGHESPGAPAAVARACGFVTSTLLALSVGYLAVAWASPHLHRDRGRG
jgi:hypothetical protein